MKRDRLKNESIYRCENKYFYINGGQGGDRFVKKLFLHELGVKGGFSFKFQAMWNSFILSLKDICGKFPKK